MQLANRSLEQRSWPQSLVPLHLFALLFLALMAPQSAQARMALPTNFADLVEEHGQAVVNVYTSQIVKPRQQPNFPFRGNPHELPDFFERFFNMPPSNGRQPLPPQKRQSLGSGVIVSKDGYILTNNHVVANADEVNIRFANHQEFTAKIIGLDEMSDLALLKIDTKEKLPYVKLGNSDKLRVGDWVVAIGNPFGLEQTVTAGIVSGKGRSISGGAYDNFIQTDASINPGNSGGPLFNLAGEMVGINTAIFSRSGGNIGIGFAIPVNMAKNVMEQLKDKGEVTRGWLGVRIQAVNQDIAEQFGLKKPHGALVGEVEQSSPAAKAGLRAGDIITRFNDKEIRQMSMLPSLVAQRRVGEKAKLTIFRQGKKKEVMVTLGELKHNGNGNGKVVSQAEGRELSSLGLTVQEITPELVESLGLTRKSGVMVSDVKRGSSAGQAGLRRGDIIVEINRAPVTTPASLKKIIAKNKGKDKLLFFIQRKESSHFVVVRNK
ncbi:MAG: DegQ family serine endoprotease [Thermodesulfobacteriota bacterium]